MQIRVCVDESSSERREIEIPLSSTQQFQLITEQFPIIKELKERLGLDLNY